MPLHNMRLLPLTDDQLAENCFFLAFSIVRCVVFTLDDNQNKAN